MTFCQRFFKILNELLIFKFNLKYWENFLENKKNVRIFYKIEIFWKFSKSNNIIEKFIEKFYYRKFSEYFLVSKSLKKLKCLIFI